MDTNGPASFDRDRDREQDPPTGCDSGTESGLLIPVLAAYRRRLGHYCSDRRDAAQRTLIVDCPSLLARSALAVTIMMFSLAAGLARQVRAQTLCEVPGGSGVIQLAVGIIVSLVALGAIVKFGAGFLQWLTGSQRAFYFSVAAGIIAIFVAANFDAIVPWLFEQVSSGGSGGGGLGAAGVDCMTGGGG